MALNTTPRPIPARDQLLLRWHERIRNDVELRFPHRKILDVFLGQYDFAHAQFRELQYSRLVKHARIGKSKANTYLGLLEQKGYL